MSLTLGRISFFTFWAKSLPKGRTAENTQDIGKSAEKAASRQRKGNGRRLKSKEQDSGRVAEKAVRRQAGKERETAGG